MIFRRLDRSDSCTEALHDGTNRTGATFCALRPRQTTLPHGRFTSHRGYRPASLVRRFLNSRAFFQIGAGTQRSSISNPIAASNAESPPVTPRDKRTSESLPIVLFARAKTTATGRRRKRPVDGPSVTNTRRSHVRGVAATPVPGGRAIFDAPARAKRRSSAEFPLRRGWRSDVLSTASSTLRAKVKGLRPRTKVLPPLPRSGRASTNAPPSAH
ncbi:hypothetical protein ACHAWF_010869 [Thalassiosira exigua]